MIHLLPRLVPLVLRHLVAYLELAADEAAELVQNLARRLFAAAIALVAGLVTVLLGCMWVIVQTWDTQWRGLTIAVLFVLFGLATAVYGVKARRGWRSGQQAFARLRTEWASDQLLLQDAFDDAQDVTTENHFPDLRRVPER